MIIKRYSDFISEKISITSVDSPSVASAANSINQIESYVKEFKTKRVNLENIYVTSQNEKDLVSKLSAQKFINPTGNKSQMKFLNPLLGEYARVCDLKKQLSDFEKEKSGIETSIKDKESQSSSNPQMKDSLMQDITSKKTDIENVKRRINEIKMECDRLERNTMAKLSEFEKEIRDGSKEIKQDRSLIKT